MTEEIDKELKPKRIQIKTESGSKWFKTVDDFINWSSSQKSLYQFVSQLPNQNNERGIASFFNQHWQPIQQFAQQMQQRKFDTEEQYANQVDNLVNEFNQKIDHKLIFTEDAALWKFVERTKDVNPLDAAFSLAYFFNINLNNWNMNILKSVQKAIDWERDFEGRVPDEEAALSSLKSSWDEEFNRINEAASNTQNRLDLLTGRADKLISAQQKRLLISMQN